MNVIGNIIWFFLGGFAIALLYWLLALLFCLTIVGVPFGLQLFKIGSFVLFPFGRDLVEGVNAEGCLNTLFNVLWIVLGWWEIALSHFICGAVFCCSIVGIPFGLQHFKIALKTLLPFGKQIVLIRQAI